MKSSGEVMDIIAAYREVGTYRGAAAICGTTHKTVKRVVERSLSGGTRPERRPRERNFDSVADLVVKRVEKTKARISAKRLLPEARTAVWVEPAATATMSCQSPTSRWPRLLSPTARTRPDAVTPVV